MSVIQEKRREGPRQGDDDRRKIPRFQDATVMESLKQIRMWIMGFAALTAISAAGTLISGFLEGPLGLTRSIFITTTLTLVSAVLFRYARAIKFYEANESVSNLQRLMEEQLTLWKTLGILATILLASFWIFIY